MIVSRRPDARRPGPKGTGRILANGRQLSQSSSDRGGHAVKLPTGFLADRLRSVRCGPAGGRGGIRGGTQSVRAHMRDTGGRLPGRTGGGHRCGSCHLARGGAADETAADLPCDASSPRAKARVRAIPSRGRRFPVASASNNPSTHSAQSTAQAATIRRSASISVCGEITLEFSLADSSVLKERSSQRLARSIACSATPAPETPSSPNSSPTATPSAGRANTPILLGSH